MNKAFENPGARVWRTASIQFLTVVLLAFLSTLNYQLSTAFAQGTAFTYQGHLNVGANSANGLYDLQFGIYDAATSGNLQGALITNSATPVSNGLFTVTLDFGNQFPGAARWLDISVCTNGAGAFVPLTPRQQLTPAPYAITAENVNGAIQASQLSSIGNTDGGGGNFFVGPSGNATTSGSDNTANGVNALVINTSGSGNTANGYGALSDNTSGSGNTANGADALGYNRSGINNTAVGIDALSLNVSGSDNIGIGLGALYYNTSGSNNIALGLYAGYQITASSDNIDIGNSGLSTDTNIIRIGNGQTETFLAGVINGDAGGLTDLSAAQITSIGNTNGGNYNFFVGPSGNATTTGFQNTASGEFALLSNTSGSENTAGGTKALEDNTTGSFNTANGFAALLSNTNGTSNTGIGASALGANESGSFNTGIGAFTLSGNISGSNNIALGVGAGQNITNSSNIDIGDPGVSSDNNIIRIGSGQAQTFIAGVINGNGSGLTNLNVSQLTSGTLPSAALTGTYSSVLNFNNAGNSFSGNGGGLTNLNASQLSGGNVADALLSANVALHSGPNAFNGNLTVTNGNVGIGTNNPGPNNVEINPTFESANGYGLVVCRGDYGENVQVDEPAGGGGIGLVVDDAAQGDSSTSLLLIRNNVASSAQNLLVVGADGTVTMSGNCSANSFVTTSDRNAKENFRSVSAAQVLAKVSALPIEEWNFKTDTATRHIGPMAQDFFAAFGVGPDDKHIATVDEDGVALAAIQGLNQKMEDGSQRAEDQIQELKAENAELKERLEKLERIVNDE